MIFLNILNFFIKIITMTLLEHITLIQNYLFLYFILYAEYLSLYIFYFQLTNLNILIEFYLSNIIY